MAAASPAGLVDWGPVLELSPKKNKSSRSDTPVTRKYSEEWDLAAKRSCLNMSVMEPCVNKAVTNLGFLNDLVHGRSRVPSRQGQNYKKQSAISGKEAGQSDAYTTTKPGDLVAEGVGIGIPKNPDGAVSSYLLIEACARQ